MASPTSECVRQLDPETSSGSSFHIHIPPRTFVASQVWDPIVENQKNLRLTALSLDPSCFSSTHEREIRLERKDWEARLLNPNVYTLVAVQDPIDSNPAPLLDARGFDRLARQPWLGNAVLIHKKNESLAASSLDDHNSSAVFYIEGVYVLPLHRSLGVGRSLIQACKEYAFLWARDHGVENVKLCVRVYSANEKAIRLYRRIGFNVSVEEAALDEITMFLEANVSET